MSRDTPRAVLAAVAIALAVAASADGSGNAVDPGDPERGALLWQEQSCGSCHTLARAGSTGKAGANIDRWLVPHAIRAKLPVGQFALSRVTWGGRGMVAYGPSLSDREIEDLVSFVLGRPFSAPPGGVACVTGFDPPPPLVVAGRATVRRWVGARQLRGAAARGAWVFAREGCLLVPSLPRKRPESASRSRPEHNREEAAERLPRAVRGAARRVRDRLTSQSVGAATPSSR